MESAAALFQLLDSNHDGLLDRGEFLRHIFPDERLGLASGFIDLVNLCIYIYRYSISMFF